jgi:ATP-dependent exoDNAse (exonuclease V) beta subunit
VQGWSKDATIDEARAAGTLALDSGALERFRGVWEGLAKKLAVETLEETLRWLIGALDWNAWWHAQPHGRQAVANVSAFVRLVRDHEASAGSDGMSLLRRLSALRGGDGDPASGGLDAGADAAVVITTYWQAKGLEWPVVVLPDLEKTKADRSGSTLGVTRVFQPARAQAAQIPEVKITLPDKSPFEVHHTVLKNLVDDVRKPADRAELRRLLYVATTRAKDRLVLTGTFSAPSEAKATRMVGEAPAMSLDQASNWAETLMVCTGLTFDSAGTPTLGDGVWTDADVVLREVVPSEPPSPTAPQPATLPDVAAAVASWRPVVAEKREIFRPSDAKSAVVPPPLGPPDWPLERETRSTPFGHVRHEGTAFHALMEVWGFGAGGAALDDDIARKALDAVGMRPHPREADRIRRLLDLVAETRDAQPDLFARLADAAAKGLLLHEATLRFEDSQGRFINGQVDLMWHEHGAWHILDYKAGWAVPTVDAPLESSELRKHHAQVELYREGVRRMLGDDEVATTGVWYVSRGLVVQWRAASPSNSA